MRKIITIFVLLLAGLVCLSGIAMTADAPTKENPMVIRLASTAVVDPLSPEANAPNATVFKYMLERLSQGRIKVELFPAGQLGNQVKLVEQALRGEIEVIDTCVSTIGTLTNYPKGNIFEIPYLFKSPESAFEFLDVNREFMTEFIDEVVEKTGLRMLFYAPSGFKQLTNNKKPIEKLEDLKGLKIRIMEVECFKTMYSAWGARPTPMTWSELYTSLQTGVVDGEDSTLPNVVAASLYEVQKYMTLTDHVMFVAGLFANETWFQSLPEDLKLAVMEAAKTTRIATTGAALIHESKALETLKKHGMQVSVLSAEQKEKFKEAAQTAVIDYFIDNGVKKEFIDRLLDEIKDVETALGYDKR